MAKKTAAEPAERAEKQSRISVERYFEISLLLMLATGFMTLASTGKLDLVSTVAVSAALGVKLWSYLREADWSLAPRTITRLAIFYLLFYALDLLIFSPGPTLLDRMLAATVHLVLFATVIKVFSARTYRDYAYLGTLSFLIMLASAILTVGTFFLAGFTLYVLFAISTFISYEIKRSTEAARRPPEGPFSTAVQNRKSLENALMTTTLGLALGIVALASIIFFVIPRYRKGYLTGLGMERQNITGFSEVVDMGDMRKILGSNAVVMRVMVEGNPRQAQGVKWRGMGLTSFDGKQWYKDNTEQIQISPASSRRFEFAQPERWSFQIPEFDGLARRPHNALRYTVLLSALSTDVLFAAAFPREVTARFNLLGLDQTESLHNPQHGYMPLSYEVVSDTGLPSPDQLRRTSADYPNNIRLVYLSLPVKIDPRVRELAQQITASASNNYDRALALQNYLRDNFGYSLNPPAIEPADPIGSFLFKSKTGYCEYFAAAMTLMARTLNIPARLVNGFRTGSYNRVGKDLVIRARDAHSWVEVYFADYGWIPFDPTPPDPNPVLAGIFDDYLDALGLFWNEWVINYDFAHQVQLAREVEQDSRQFERDFRRRYHRFQQRGIRAAYRIEGWLMAHKLLVLMLMLGALCGLLIGDKSGSLDKLRFWLSWKFQRRDRALGQRDAILTYQRFLKTLQKKGFRKSPSQTPWEFALSFVGTRMSHRVAEFTRLYNALRFGQAPVSRSRLRTLLDDLAQT